MMNPPDNGNPSAHLSVGGWLKRNYLSVAIFLFVVVIVVGLFIFVLRYPDKVKEFESLGYLGAFLISLLANATVLLPFPGTVVLFSLGAAFNPFFVGLAAGAGGGIGELTGYLAGFSGRGIWQDNKTYRRAEAWLKKWGSLFIFVFAATPLPMDVAGIISGNLRFPIWKFLIACWLGKTIQSLVLAYTGAWGWETIIRQHWDIKSLGMTGLAIIAVAVILALALFLERWTWRRGR